MKHIEVKEECINLYRRKCTKDTESGKSESIVLTFWFMSHPHLSPLKVFIHRCFRYIDESMRAKIKIHSILEKGDFTDDPLTIKRVGTTTFFGL